MKPITNRLQQKRFYDEWSPLMFAVCIKYSRTREDAEDALQNGFVKVFNSLHTFRGECQIGGWMYSIFRNVSIIQLRKNKVTSYEPLDTQNVDTSETGLQRLYNKDLEKEIELLQPGYRSTFKLHNLGYQHKEIGQLMGVTESCSKSQYCRAKKLLTKKLKRAQSL